MNEKDKKCIKNFAKILFNIDLSEDQLNYDLCGISLLCWNKMNEDRGVVPTRDFNLYPNPIIDIRKTEEYKNRETIRMSKEEFYGKEICDPDNCDSVKAMMQAVRYSAEQDIEITTLKTKINHLKDV